mgnify:FL=1
MNVLDVCCGRSLMLPLLRYYAKDIASYTGVDISKANIKEAMRGATAKNLEPKDLTSYYRSGWVGSWATLLRCRKSSRRGLPIL